METIDERQINQAGILLFTDEGEYGVAIAERHDNQEPHYFKVYRTNSERKARHRYQAICNAISETRIY